MRTPDDIATIAATRYRSTWRETLLTGRSSPCSLTLHPPTAAEIIANPEAVGAWLRAWRTHTPAHPGKLRTKTIHARYGDQPIHTHLDLPNLAALAGLNADTRRHWAHVTNRWTRLHPASSNVGTLRPWLTQIMDLDDHDFDLLLAASSWFRTNPKSGYTIRRVPVPGMHTKWLARNRRLVLAVLALGASGNGDADTNGDLGNLGDLGDVSDIDIADLPQNDLDSLGLRPVPREADILLADPADRKELSGLHHLRAPIDELARLPLTPHTVLIVENKEAALALDDAAGLVVVHSLGNHTEVLRHLPWLPANRVFYWGDLDRHGYTLLSRARSAVITLQSLLMAHTDIADNAHLGVIETLNRYDQPDNTLTSAELSGLNALTQPDGYLRIEQERLPHTDVQAAVNAAFVAGG